LIGDDLLAERLASNVAYHRSISDLEHRLDVLEKKVDTLHPGIAPPKSELDTDERKEPGRMASMTAL
jgi:hypothetical protein